jgi:hypothetical protein
MFGRLKAYSQKEWAFCFYILHLTTYALRVTVRKVRVDEVSGRKNKCRNSTTARKVKLF